MSSENVEIVRRGYALFAAGDLDGAAALLSPVAEVPDSGGLGTSDSATGTRQGPSGFLRAVAETLDAFDEYRVDAEDFIDAGDAVVVPVRISGRGKGSGMALETRVAHVWFLENGRGVRGEVHRSVAEALEAAGVDRGP